MDLILDKKLFLSELEIYILSELEIYTVYQTNNEVIEKFINTHLIEPLINDTDLFIDALNLCRRHKSEYVILILNKIPKQLWTDMIFSATLCSMSTKNVYPFLTEYHDLKAIKEIKKYIFKNKITNNFVDNILSVDQDLTLSQLKVILSSNPCLLSKIENENKRKNPSIIETVKKSIKEKLMTRLDSGLLQLIIYLRQQDLLSFKELIDNGQIYLVLKEYIFNQFKDDEIALSIKEKYGENLKEFLIRNDFVNKKCLNLISLMDTNIHDEIAHLIHASELMNLDSEALNQLAVNSLTNALSIHDISLD